jgi:RNA polymerase sigma-70 factor (ECF subfamily)
MEWSQTLMREEWAAETPGKWPQTRAGFEALVGRMEHPLVRFACRRLASLADAEDVVQDVLVRSVLERDRLARITAVDAYLYRMVANRCTDRLRARAREAPLTEARDSAAPDPRMERWERIDALLERLPAREAEAIRLRIYGDLEFEMAARVAGVATPTLKSRFRSGVERLRKLIGSKEAKR